MDPHETRFECAGSQVVDFGMFSSRFDLLLDIQQQVVHVIKPILAGLVCLLFVKTKFDTRLTNT